MKKLCCAILVLFPACSGADDKSCSLEHHVGTFVAHYDVLSGDCGPLPDEVATVEDPHGVPQRCSLPSPDAVSADECTLKRHVSCPGNDGSAVEVISELRESDADTFAGEVSFTLRDADGIPTCNGRYKLSMKRR